MSTERRNAYLDHGSADESDGGDGYDSEAAEISKAGRASKRRKIEQEYTDDEEEDIESASIAKASSPTAAQAQPDEKEADDRAGPERNQKISTTEDVPPSSALESPIPAPNKRKDKDRPKTKSKEAVPGVIYLSSLPPYLKPSALRNLLEQRGFAPVKRLFLSPASRHKSTSRKNSRQRYTEGWIEFASKKTARRCAETLNAQTVGGPKGGYYRDDVWNMKYLKGMGWEELMAGVREEKREEEGRRDEERRVIARETRAFVEGVEEGRRREGMRRKRERKGGNVEKEIKGDGEGEGEDEGREVKRTWRQVEVKGRKTGSDNAAEGRINDDVKQVLGKIF